LIEGPPGTSKSTSLRAITAEWGVPLLFVEGNADLTRAKQICHHNLARVLHEDHRAASFIDGRCSRRYVANADATGDLFDRPRHARLCGGGQSASDILGSRSHRPRAPQPRAHRRLRISFLTPMALLVDILPAMKSRDSRAG
jgi:hypothetical protein